MASTQICSWTWLVAAGAGLLVPSTEAAASPSTNRIDPLLRVGSPAMTTPAAERAAVLRLPDLTPAGQAELERQGVRFRRAPDGTTRHLGDLYPVDATSSVLSTLAHRGTHVRVSRRMEFGPTLLDTGVETQAVDLRGSTPTPIVRLRDERPTVGVLDSGINIFHPHYFRADGGAWPWIDADDDGVFTVGVDGVDANQDGQLAANERLELLDYGFTAGKGIHGYDGTFQTAWDYLFLDLNTDGVRNFGTSAGFSEETAGYGEAMFLPDDANGDGVLGVDEKVILLGTSQIKGLRVGSFVFERGVNLISTPLEFTTASHGTLTTGVITGGQVHPFRGNRSPIPDADIALMTYDDPTDAGSDEAEMVEGLAWLTQDMESVVVNHSWGARGDREHHDGSNFLDSVIDSATSEGSVQVCSAGNRRQLGKHRETTTSAGEASFVVLQPSSIQGSPASTLTFDLHWPAEEGDFACSAQRPDGAVHDVAEIPNGDFEGLNVDAYRSDSERGWAMLSIEVTHPTGAGVGSGGWTFTCTHDSSEDFLVHAVVSDGITFGQAGTAFAEPSVQSTVGSPATADTCIAVGGYPIQYPPSSGSVLDRLEPYSSWGPRFDGVAVVDIAAPVDAVVPTVDASRPNAYRAFSGTSGAAPQVSAVVALMKELDPSLTPDEIRERIHQGAETGDIVGVTRFPDDGWGYGRLRGYEALTGEAPPPRPRVQSIELVASYAYQDGDCAVTISVEGADWSDASFRWDAEYDGIWDGTFEAEPSLTLVLPADETAFHVRADAAQRGFIIAGATLVGDAPESCFDEPPPEPTGGSDSGTAGGDSTSSGSDGDGTTTGDTEAGAGSAGGGDGCGCRTDQRGGGAGWGFGLLALVGARRRRSRRRPNDA